MNTTDLMHWATVHKPAAITATVVTLTVLLTMALLLRRGFRAAREAGRGRGITVLINVAALLATSVQASGMWKFFDRTMGLPVGFRIVLFGFMEIALLACGLRARANVEDGADAGIDGVLVWALALASGVMSSTDASSAREALMRVMVAVVVAALWSRDLLAAKKAARAGGARRTGPIRWRITGERLFVWLRLADAVDTTVQGVEAGRRVSRYLRATDRAARSWRRPWSPEARADRARMRLTTHALMHGDPTAVHERLADAAFADALDRLGIGAVAGPTVGESAVPDGESAPDPSESEAPSGVSQNAGLILPGDSVFAQVEANLPPALVHPVNGRPKVAAASAPARRQATITARIAGADREEIVRMWKASRDAGKPLSTRALAKRAGVSQSTVMRAVAEQQDVRG